MASLIRRHAGKARSVSGEIPEKLRGFGGGLPRAMGGGSLTGTVKPGPAARKPMAKTCSSVILLVDDNQHGFDENLRIKNLWDGIELMAALLSM